jgi:2-haloacid dehalogenase
LSEAWTLLFGAKANILVITNGSKETTQGYIKQASLEKMVKSVKSCDEVGVGKPLDQVYESAKKACEEIEGEVGGNTERWFVAAHMWDLAAAKKAG